MRCGFGAGTAGVGTLANALGLGTATVLGCAETGGVAGTKSDATGRAEAGTAGAGDSGAAGGDSGAASAGATGESALAGAVCHGDAAANACQLRGAFEIQNPAALNATSAIPNAAFRPRRRLTGTSGEASAMRVTGATVSMATRSRSGAIVTTDGGGVE